MTSPHTLLPLRSAGSRARHLQDELRHALSMLEGATLKAWGKRSSMRLLMLAGRRVGGLARLATLLIHAGGDELVSLLSATRGGRLKSHLGDRTANAIDTSLDIGRDSLRLINTVGRGLLNNPKANAHVVLGTLLGFGAGSGGLDGNGGIPDLDLLGGIAFHRSPLTHTIIAGIVVEGLLLAMADLAAEIHGNLPDGYDPIWDSLANIGRPLTQSLAIGTSAGLAYHLMVDALIQPAPYHDLPLAMPMEEHRAFMGANGVAEGEDARLRAREELKSARVVIIPAQTVGRKVFDAAAANASVAADTLARGFKAISRKWGLA